MLKEELKIISNVWENLKKGYIVMAVPQLFHHDQLSSLYEGPWLQL